MKPILIIYPNIAIDSVTKLQAALIAANIPCKIENPYETKNKTFSVKNYALLFNYGISKLTNGVRKLNKALFVKTSISKINSFNIFKATNIPCPNFTTDYKEALTWVKDHIIAVRSIENGNNTDGLTFCQTKACITKNKTAPLFTQYIPHNKEFRINCWKDEIVSVYEKILVNNNTGFKFKLLKNFNDNEITTIVQKLYKALPLDWYGLDIILGEDNKYYVLEINSAPILFPYTINKLINKLKKELINE